MRGINIILMLSTIVPGLDSCCTRTLQHRKPLQPHPLEEFPSSKQQAREHSIGAIKQQPPQTTNLYIKKDNQHFITTAASLNYSQTSNVNKSKMKTVIPEGAQTIHNITDNYFIPDPQYKLMTDILSKECEEMQRLEFCLNGGRCFSYPIFNQSLTSCECADGYYGERCEVKSFEFIPQIRPRVALAQIPGGPLIFGLIALDAMILIFLLRKKYNRF